MSNTRIKHNEIFAFFFIVIVFSPNESIGFYFIGFLFYFQFSLDHVQRLEQMDKRNAETRQTLENKLGQFSRLTRPLLQRRDQVSCVKKMPSIDVHSSLLD